MSRDNWDTYFLKIALTVATRATCDRLHAGAVIVKNGNILATGYNGSITGLPHCDDVGHEMVDGHCVRTVHAERNAIGQAAKHNGGIDGATIYLTATPCWPCFQLLVNSGIKRIVYDESYRSDPMTLQTAFTLGIELVQIRLEETEDPKA